MVIKVGTNTQQSDREAVGWGWTMQGKRAANNTTRGERPTMARQLGSRQHKDDRRGTEDTMQGNLMVDGTTRGGGGGQRTRVVKRGTQQSTNNGGRKEWTTVRQWARATCEHIGGGQEQSLGGGIGQVAGRDRYYVGLLGHCTRLPMCPRHCTRSPMCPRHHTRSTMCLQHC
jgi:hypothetical protein